MLKNVAKARRSDKLNAAQPIEDVPTRRRRAARPQKTEQPDASPALPPAERRRLLMLASEAMPFAKTGGLADVLGALPPALARLGWDVTVALPKYRGVDGGSLRDQFPVTVGGFTRNVAFLEAPLADGTRAWLVDCPDLFDRQGLYGVDTTDYPDNALRFAMLVRATLEFAGRQDSPPSLVHAHDWQTGLAPVYL